MGSVYIVTQRFLLIACSPNNEINNKMHIQATITTILYGLYITSRAGRPELSESQIFVNVFI